MFDTDIGFDTKIQINPADQIPFTRCTAKLRRIDTELHKLKFTGIRVWDPDLQDYIHKIYDVHDSHQYAAYEHVLSMLLDAEALAHQIKSFDLRNELLKDVHLRRLAFYDCFK